MEWVKKNYDLAFLILATLVLAGNAAWLATTGFSDSALPAAASAPDNTFAQPDLPGLQQAAAAMAQPQRWKSAADVPSDSPRGSLLVSRAYLLKDGKLIDPIEGSEQLHPPIDNEWLLRNGLDYTDMSIKDTDSDADGFTNLEEFLAKTSPVDPKQSPPALNKLKLVQFSPKPFRLIFKGDPSGEGKEFQINLKDIAKGSPKTQYRALGDLVEGAPYKLLRYEAKEGPNDKGIVENLSELTLENIETGDSIVLVFNKEANDPTSFGTFRNLLFPADEDFTLKKGDEFSVKPETGVKLKLIDVSADNAQIQDVANGQVYRVLPLNAP